MPYLHAIYKKNVFVIFAFNIEHYQKQAIKKLDNIMVELGKTL